MIKATFAAVTVIGLLEVDSAFAQQTRQPTAQARTQAIVASFNKSKHRVKEKYGVRVEKYKEVRSEPAIRANVRDYAGAYEVQGGLGFSLDLKVDGSGNIAATGYEPVDDGATVMRKFTLRNARIEGALLTATKVYASGATEPFEGVFINRTSFESPRDKGVTTFGLGVIGPSTRVMHGVHMDRFFFERKR
jgi:hypothetical protein